MKRLAVVLSLFAILGSGYVLLQFPRSLTEAGYETRTFRIMSAVTTAANGTATYLGPYEQMLVFPQIGVDASNTYDVNCGVSGSKTSAATVFDEVLATTNTMDGYVMPQGHPCEWIRIDKVADDGTATTIDVQIIRPVRR